jgi:hypothetical protein
LLFIVISVGCRLLNVQRLYIDETSKEEAV